ncbi:hypothetical protein Tco_1535580, partial [Tanacetum coccineum]
KSSDEDDNDEVNVSKDDDNQNDDADNEDDDEVNVSEDDDDQNDDNADNEGDNDQDDDNKQTESENDDDDLIHLKLSTFDEKERQDKEDKEEEWDVNVNLEGRDTEMTDAPQTNIQDVPVSTNVEMPPLSVTPLPLPLIPFIQPQQQTPVFTPIIVPSTSLQNLPTFDFVFKFEDRVKALEDDFSEFKQTNQFTAAVSSILGIVDTYLANKMNEAIKITVQLQSDRLRNESQAENEDFINKFDDNIKKIIKEQVKAQVKEQVTKILPRIEKTVNAQIEAKDHMIYHMMSIIVTGQTL